MTRGSQNGRPARAAGPGLEVGIVGAGRTRGGLGPFLAWWCERADLRVRGVAGRNQARAQAAAHQLGERLGHDVEAHADVEALARSGIAALVVATPPELHLAGLRAASAAGIACLCEKPLVLPRESAMAAAVVESFAARGQLLVENCQWPFVLPVFDRLHPGRRAAPERVAMGLSPGQGGAGMVLDSLSHLLSLVQAVVPTGAGLRLRSARLDPPWPAGHAGGAGGGAGGGESMRECRLVLDLRHASGALEAVLELEVVPEQPRPAFVAIDGRRMDRRIGTGYAISFADGEREEAAEDPLALLVDDFARRLRAPSRADAAVAAAAVAERMRLYAEVVGAVLPDP